MRRAHTMPEAVPSDGSRQPAVRGRLVGDDGSVETVVETSHTTVAEAEAWYLLGVVVVADVLLLTLELWRVLRLGRDGDEERRGIVEGLGVVAHAATAFEGGLVVCEWRTQLR